MKIWYFLIVGLVVFLTCICYLNYPLAYNQGLYHYQGLVMKTGGIPYTDFIEKKGPMGLLFYSLGALLFGPSPFAYRLFDLLVQATSAFFLYRILKKKATGFVSLIVPFIWFSHTIVEGPENTADVTNIITLCLVTSYYLLVEWQPKNDWLVGMLMAAACWVKPTAVIMFLPVWHIVSVNHAGQSSIKEVYQSILKVLMGGVGVSIGFVAYLLITDSWQGFWEAVVLDPLLNYVDDRSRIGLRLIQKLGIYVIDDPSIRFIGSIGLLLAIKKRYVRIALLFFTCIFLSIIVEGKYFPYHFTPLWPFAAIGLFSLIEAVKERMNRKILVQGAVVILLLILPLLPVGLKFIQAGFFLPGVATDESKLFRLPDIVDLHNGRKPAIAFLKKEMTSEETIYAIAIDPNIYIDLNKTSTCRSIRDGVLFTVGMHPVDPPPHLAKWEEEIIDHIESKPDWLMIDNKLPGGELTEEYADRINAVLTGYGTGVAKGRYTLYRKL
ncbi:MAG: glycosyltransferase family 39 protein [Bacteroidota bacterium]